MKQNLITDVIQGMLPYLNNAQTERLQEVLQYTLFDYEVTKIKKDEELSEQNLVESFLSAKRIEGCSEKTLNLQVPRMACMPEQTTAPGNSILPKRPEKNISVLYCTQPKQKQ